MLERLLPRAIDNRFAGHRSALWLLGLYVALKLVMSLNSIFNTASVASGADGFLLESYGGEGARAVLMLFALVAVGQLALALVGVLALVRYRAMVPLVFLLLLAEHAARRVVVDSYAVERGASAGFWVNVALAAVLVAGLSLSMWKSRGLRD